MAIISKPAATGFLLAIGVLGALLIGSALGPISTTLVYITLAMFLAVGLDPVVQALERRGVKRALAIGIVFAGLLIFVVGFALIVLPPMLTQVEQFVHSVPASIAAIPDSNWFGALGPDLQSAILNGLSQIGDWITEPTTIATLSGGVFAAGVGFVSGISATFIVVALTLYFLASLTATKQALYAVSPAWSRPRVQDLTERITGSVGRSLLGELVLSSFNAAAVFCLHLAIGLPYPALMGVVAFVVALIPLFGSVIFWILGTAVALFTSPLQALVFGLSYFIYIQLESYVISPRVMNKAIAIPPALVLIGALAGGALMGVVGVLVALPVVASIMLIIREVLIPRQDSKAKPMPRAETD